MFYKKNTIYILTKRQSSSTGCNSVSMEQKIENL